MRVLTSRPGGRELFYSRTLEEALQNSKQQDWGTDVGIIRWGLTIENKIWFTILMSLKPDALCGGLYISTLSEKIKKHIRVLVHLVVG